MTGEVQPADMPNNARNNESGRFVQKYPNEEFFDAIRAEGGETGTPEIADRVGCFQDTALKRLHSLADEGLVGHRKVAGVNLWSIADE